MKLNKPKGDQVRIKAYHNKVRNTYRVEATSYDPMGRRKNSFSFTVYETDLDEIKDLLIKTFEEHTGEQFPLDAKRSLKTKELLS